ncbi:PmoA family protein [Aeoliella sp. ICT_H6.2]|uniref:PmoA family protein n=1 Tax=Aeoliella straminimaris TaxID=2954799 RepID=A0A9X2FA38_9BACT|nr:DUF6807 family protein [Aeoliella straminimaris]MCO6042514.1 PmoA family protein [Aeoliella straminimaris]
MNITSCVRSLALIPLSMVLVTTTSRAEDSAGYSWNNNESQHYAELSFDGSPLVRYMYAPLDESSDAKRAETYKPYLHVYSPDGSQIITKGPGGLYPHHRGIYFGFNKITYGDGKRCDTWHCTNGAYEQNESIDSIDADDDSGTLETTISWHGKGGELFANESRKQTISKTGDMTQIDFESQLECADGIDKIHLDGDPQHAGVQFRASQKVADETAKQTYYVRTDGKGKPGETRNWNHTKKDDPVNGETTNRPWLAMSVVIDGARYTVLYLDHPDNPKPAHYSERDYGRFGSYFVTDVTPDKPLDVKYRYFIKPGEMTVDECQKLHDEFVGQR